MLNVSFLGTRGEVILHTLEGEGIYVSTGSACSSKKKGANRVLTAMGIPPARQDSTIRISFCPENTAEEIDDMIRREEFPQTDHILAWMLWKNKEDHP